MDELDVLYDAAIVGDAEAIAKLKIKADTVNDDGKTLLHIESESGNTKRVRFILREFAYKNLLSKLTPYKYSALHLAIYDGHTEVADVIIEAARRQLLETEFQAFLRQGDEYMNTALDAAVMKGNVAIVKLLLEADPIDTHIQNDEDALYGAAFSGAMLAADVLINHDEESQNGKERARFIMREFENKSLLPKLSFDKQTALQLAIDLGHTEVAEVIIEEARRHMSETCFQAFLRKDDYKKDTALHLAVKKGNVANVKLLVEADPTDRHSRDYDGKTPMFIAVEQGLDDIVEIISTTCTSPSLDGPYGSTVLCIKYLDQVKSPRRTLYKIIERDALYAAAIAGDADAIANLEMQADILNIFGETILHFESRNGNTEHVRFLLREFANKNLLIRISEDKLTALHWATCGGHTEMAEVIIEAAKKQFPVTSFQAFLRQEDCKMHTAMVITAPSRASTPEYLRED
ncbi:uncharacterized protein LOC141697373 isoform X1 [Apium graveolens]|uniref:uncharacterized protein LOC141697373 isoform X1 n=2 Tax=Apium graveolens TaxID=4045 RepID=UPI003D792646